MSYALFILFGDEKVVGQISYQTVYICGSSVQFRLIVAVGNGEVPQPELLLLAPLQTPHGEAHTVDVEMLVVAVEGDAFGAFLFHDAGVGKGADDGTPSYAIMKIPFDIVAAILGLGVAYYIYFHTGFVKQFKKTWEGK